MITKLSAALARSLYLFVELIDDSFCPFEVQVTDFGWSIDICQLYAHLAHQQSIVLVGPINSWTVHIVHLFTKMDALVQLVS